MKTLFSKYSIFIVMSAIFLIKEFSTNLNPLN